MIDKNSEKIRSLFNDVAPLYDKMNNFLSFKMHYLIKILSVKFLNMKSNSNILDLCSGTGDFVKIISKHYPDCKITGLDVSSKMIEIAKQKNPNKNFILGDCTNLPFQDNEFDYITMGFGLRNIENRLKALEEIYRVLKNEGKFLHLDFGKHNFVSLLFNITTSILILFLKEHKQHYKYLINSKNDYPEPDKLVEEFKCCGFKNPNIKYFLFGAICAICVQK